MKQVAEMTWKGVGSTAKAELPSPALLMKIGKILRERVQKRQSFGVGENECRVVTGISAFAWSLSVKMGLSPLQLLAFHSEFAYFPSLKNVSRVSNPLLLFSSDGSETYHSLG